MFKILMIILGVTIIIITFISLFFYLTCRNKMEKKADDKAGSEDTTPPKPKKEKWSVKNIPKLSDESKKTLKKLGFVVAALLIWWYWYPLVEKIQSVIKNRPGIEQKTTTNDNKKEVVGVVKKKEKEEKVSYYLKWEKPRNQRLSYIDLSDGRNDVISFEEKDGGVKFTIRNPSNKNEDMVCSLQMFNGRESCGTWNGKNIYNESETVWKWKGGYIDHQGRKGQIFLTEVFSNNETKYVGKASLPNRPDKWVNLVIYQ